MKLGSCKPEATGDDHSERACLGGYMTYDTEESREEEMKIDQNLMPFFEPLDTAIYEVVIFT